MKTLNLNTLVIAGAALTLIVLPGCGDDAGDDSAATAGPSSGGDSDNADTDAGADLETEGQMTDTTGDESDTDDAADTDGGSDTEADTDASQTDGFDSDDHGTITECSGGQQEDCAEGGVRFCFMVDERVTTHEVWGECGECVPEQQQSCGKDGDNAVQFCNARAVLFSFPEGPPAWGPCTPEDQLVCELGVTEPCPDDEEATRTCVLDEAGVPSWADAACG